MSDVTAIIEQLAKEAREELDAHHEWLVENPEEPDPGCDHLFIHPDDALAIQAELTRLREENATLSRERDEVREAVKAVNYVALVIDSAVRHSEGERGLHNIALVKDALNRCRAVLPRQSKEGGE